MRSIHDIDVVIKRYLDFTTDEIRVSFDFNKVIEMPEALDIEHHMVRNQLVNNENLEKRILKYDRV